MFLVMFGSSQASVRLLKKFGWASILVQKDQFYILIIV